MFDMKTLAQKFQNYFIKAMVATGIGAATLIGAGFSGYGLMKSLAVEETRAQLAPLETRILELDKRQIQYEGSTATMLKSIDDKLNILIAARMNDTSKKDVP